jgi:hypothetical protein
MNLQKIKRVLDKHITNKYTFIGSLDSPDLIYLKKHYGDPLFIDINTVQDESFGTIGSIFCINPIVVASDKPEADTLINLFNSIGPNNHKYIMKVPKTFEFGRFIGTIKPDHIDVYNNHESHYVMISKI